MADLDILRDMFINLSPIKQVIVYAEALNEEYYELLAVIDKCITGATREDFLAAVERWNKT